MGSGQVLAPCMVSLREQDVGSGQVLAPCMVSLREQDVGSGQVLAPCMVSLREQDVGSGQVLVPCMVSLRVTIWAAQFMSFHQLVFHNWLTNCGLHYPGWNDAL